MFNVGILTNVCRTLAYRSLLEAYRRSRLLLGCTYYSCPMLPLGSWPRSDKVDYELHLPDLWWDDVFGATMVCD